MSRRKRSGREKREIRNNILIVCGGLTEKNYFQKFKADLAKVTVKPILENKDPLYIVNRAIKEREYGELEYKYIWCVFDKDNFENFDEAIRIARKNNIKIAFSNQAFELWYINHYKYVAHNMHRDKYEDELNRLMNGKYSKSDETHYEKLRNKTNIAIENTKKAHQRHLAGMHSKESMWESCTTVYQLVEELSQWRR